MDVRKCAWLVWWMTLSRPLLAGAAPGAVLTLEQARQRVQTHNPTLQAARETQRLTELLIDRAYVAIKPTWNAVASYTHNNVGAELAIPDFSSFTTNPIGFSRMNTRVIQKEDTVGLSSSLTVPLLIPRAFPLIQQANQGCELARLNTENLAEWLVQSAELAYYGAINAQKVLDIARQSEEIRGEHLKAARAKFKVGDESRMTVLRAEIDKNRAEQDAKRAENAVRLAQEVLGMLVKESPPFALVAPATLELVAASQEVMIEKARAERRDLRAARLELTLGETQEKDAWFRFLPSLLATGSLRVSDAKGFTDRTLNWNAGVSLVIPLYDGGLRTLALDEARSKIRAAQFRIEEKTLAIRSEIRQLFWRQEMARANLDKAQQSLQLAREQAELARIAFQTGSVSNLDVLDANMLLFVSELNAAQEELNLQTAILRLNRSLTLFQPGGAQPSPGPAGPVAPVSAGDPASAAEAAPAPADSAAGQAGAQPRM